MRSHFPMSSDFPTYLKRVIEEAFKRRQSLSILDEIFYVSTDAKEKNLRLMARGVMEEKERGRKEEIEPVPVLQGIQDFYTKHKHVLLIGRPGAGKSTALNQLLIDEATRALENSSLPIPVLVQLKSDRPILELIQSGLRLGRLRFSTEEVDNLLFEGKLLLLLDGVNEIPRPELRDALRSFREDNPNVLMVFTTRDLAVGGYLGIKKQLEMQPLTSSQLREFVGQCFPSQTNEFLNQLSDRLKEFGKTPLLLEVLCDVFWRTNEVPKNLGLVFRKFTRDYERDLKEGVRIESDRELWPLVLQQLAWVMMHKGEPTEFRSEIKREEAVEAIGQFLNEKFPYTEARKYLRDLENYHLIHTGTDDDELEFRHQLIQEYYAAEALLQKLPADDERLKRDYLNFLKWTQPVSLMLALVQEEAKAVRVVTQALEVDIQLGSRLAGEVRTGLAERVFQLIEQLPITESMYILLLGKTHSDEVTEVLESALKDPDLVWAAIAALEELSSAKALNILFQAVQQKIVEDYHCETILEIIGKTIDQNTSNYLQHIAKHHNVPYVRAWAARELKSFSSDDVIQTLYDAALDEHDYVRRKAISSLRQIGSLEAVTAIETAERILYGDVHDILEKIKDSGIFLGKFTRNIPQYNRTKIASPPLTSVERLRKNLTRLLSIELDIDNRNSLLDVLERVLNVPDADVRLMAIQALGEISDHRAVVLLSDALEDSNFDNRAQAAIALAKLADPSAIPALIYAFNQEENVPGSGAYVRYKIIEVLGDIGHTDAIPFLKQLLEDLQVELFDTILDAIARIESAESISFLYDLLCSGKIENTAAWMDRIQEIQIGCRYYDYEIYQDHLEAQKHDRQTPQNSDRFQAPIAHYHIQTKELTLMTDKAPIFNQQNATIGVNYAAEGSKQDFTQHINGAEQNFEVLLTGYKQFIDELYQANPNLANETEIMKTIDVEAKRIDTRWQNFLSLKRLWNGGKKAAVKVGEHFVESNPWGKGAIAFLEGVSEDVK